MPILISNINLLTALGITNKELFDAVFESFDDFDAFCHNSGYDYEFDDNDNLVIITPKSLKINTGIEIPQKPESLYFHITALENGTIKLKFSLLWLSENNLVKYSLDRKNWTEMLSSDETINVNKDDIVYVSANINTPISASIPEGQFSSSGNVNVGGNIMSLMYGDNFKAYKEMKTGVKFPPLFKKISDIEKFKVVDASQLVLPATTLALDCYFGMFSGCTSLTTPPALPATKLADFCYYEMFKDCTSLTKAPELPATKLAANCYGWMFLGCTSLTEAPELPATTLIYYCYLWMFNGCTSLTKAPELPATLLVSSCYKDMFGGCTNLNYIKAMFTTTPSSRYTLNWVSGVAATGTFVKNSAAEWNVTGADGIPDGWTVETADS